MNLKERLMEINDVSCWILFEQDDFSQIAQEILKAIIKENLLKKYPEIFAGNLFMSYIVKNENNFDYDIIAMPTSEYPDFYAKTDEEKVEFIKSNKDLTSFSVENPELINKTWKSYGSYFEAKIPLDENNYSKVKLFKIDGKEQPLWSSQIGEFIQKALELEPSEGLSSHVMIQDNLITGEIKRNSVIRSVNGIDEFQGIIQRFILDFLKEPRGSYTFQLLEKSNEFLIFLEEDIVALSFSSRKIEHGNYALAA